MRKYFFATALLFVLSANFVFAKTLSDIQISAIIGMLKGFGVDSSIVSKVESTLKDNKLVSEVVAGAIDSACPKINRHLSLGAKGQDVAELQRFLKKKGFYKYPEITGYYGPVTMRAVQEFQKAQAIVSSGNVYSTGFGAFGPKTHRALKALCSGTQAGLNPQNPSGPENTVCTQEYRPVCGRKYPQVSNMNLKKVAPKYITYSNLCKLKADGAVFAYNGECKKIDKADTKADTAASKKMSASSTVGSAPLTVNFELEAFANKWMENGYTVQIADRGMRYIDFGDGAKQILRCANPSSSTCKVKVSHTYSKPGTYKATLFTAGYYGPKNDDEFFTRADVESVEILVQ